MITDHGTIVKVYEGDDGRTKQEIKTDSGTTHTFSEGTIWYAKGGKVGERVVITELGWNTMAMTYAEYERTYPGQLEEKNW